MTVTMRLWLLGMGIPPEQVETDARFMSEVKAQEGLGAWERLQVLSYKFKTYPEFSTTNAQLEFMSIVNGRPQLWM